MSDNNGWHPERYWALLLLQARQMCLNERLQSRFDPEEVVQDTIVQAHKALSQFRGQTDGKFVCWLQKILENMVNDRIRHETAGIRDVAREQSLAAVAESSAYWQSIIADRGEAPDREAELSELRLRVAEALEQLPEDYRNVVICRHLSDMSVAKIAKTLNRTEKAVAGLLLRGRRKLRKLLKDYEPGGD